MLVSVWQQLQLWIQEKCPLFLCHGVIQTKEKAAWMTHFYFLSLGNCNLGLPVHCECHKRLRAYDLVKKRGKKIQSTFLYSAHILWLMVKFVRQQPVCSVFVFYLTHLGQWFMWHRIPWTHTRMHTTPVVSSSSQRGAKVPFPCVFRLFFNLDWPFSRLKEKFLLGVVNLQNTNHHFLVHWGGTYSVIYPLRQLLRHFMRHSALCSLSTACL